MTVSLRSILSNGALLTTLILQFIPGISGYDPSLGLSKLCMDRCDKPRSRGWTGSFFFNCETEYLNDSNEKKKCQDDCTQCPDICDLKGDNHNFKCPKTETEEECKNLCDSVRPKGNLNGYELHCEEVYRNPLDVSKCTQTCVKCPNYVCNDKIDTFLFYCPTGEFPKTSQCWQDCEKYRDAENEDLAYSFHCSMIANISIQKECLESCKDCPSFVCSSENTDKRFCPSNYPPRPLLTTRKTTPHPDKPYDGPCKRRCDEYRLGGVSAYSFTCDTIFESTQDFSQCLSDCLQCPSKVCTIEDYTSTFHCPKADNADDSKHLPPEHNLSPLCVFFIVLSLLFVLGFFSGGGLLLYKRRIHFEKKRREIKKRFTRRVSFQDPSKPTNLQVPKEQEANSSVTPASSASILDTETPTVSVSQSESSMA